MLQDGGAAGDGVSEGGGHGGGTAVRSHRGGGGVIEGDGDADGVCGLVGETGEAGEGYPVGAELAPVGSGAVAFLAPMHVERPYEGCTLTAVVVDGKKLEARVAGGA